MSKKPAVRRPKAKLDPGLLRAHKAYEAAINSNDTNRVMAMYDRDAEILQPDGPIVSGRRNIRKWVAGYFKQFKTHWKKVPLRNFMLGDYGFDEGIDTAVDTPRDGGKPIHWNCKGILIYKRQKNGEWLIFRDIWNNTTPPK
jgi:ketosteroid isomerase-like protein